MINVSTSLASCVRSTSVSMLWLLSCLMASPFLLYTYGYGLCTATKIGYVYAIRSDIRAAHLMYAKLQSLLDEMKSAACSYCVMLELLKCWQRPLLLAAFLLWKSLRNSVRSTRHSGDMPWHVQAHKSSCWLHRAWLMMMQTKVWHAIWHDKLCITTGQTSM